MSIKNILYTTLVVFLLIVVFSAVLSNSGNDSKTYKDELVIHTLSDAQGLNPVTISDATSRRYVMPNIMQSMLYFDLKTMVLKPVLAKSMPEVKEVGDLMEITYEIRPEATWDNGKPVTVDDVLFSYKSILCPKVNSDNVKSSVDYVVDIKTYPDNPKKYTVICEKNIGAVEGTGYEVVILPEYVYDTKGLLKKYTISELTVENPKCADDKNVKEFADFFNSQQTLRDPAFVQGSGAYVLKSWETGQQLTLERKKNWWGDKINKENIFFEAYPKRLVFVTINNFTTALTALKNEKLDFIFVTPVKDYIDLDNSPKFKKNFYKAEPDQLAYQAIGINHKDKILSDVKVRQALCYLIDVDQIIEKVIYNKGIRTNSAILPMKKDIINPAIKPFPFDINKAKSLLTEAGWKDSDGDGILDKVIEGKKTNLEITYNYNSGNSLREMVGLLMQRTFQQVGIEFTIKSLEWSLYLDELKKHKCQLWYQGWVTSPGLDDNKQLFHTSAANGGSNYMSFGNAKTDKILDEIRVEFDVNKRKELYYKWQEIEHEQIPYIYLYVQKYRNCIHNRFENINAGPSAYPGVWFAGFKVKKGYKVEN
ncbi:MAG: ABC transporter substrate-binding protein [Chitinophagales bacterium]